MKFSLSSGASCIFIFVERAKHKIYHISISIADTLPKLAVQIDAVSRQILKVFYYSKIFGCLFFVLNKCARFAPGVLTTRGEDHAL